MPAVELFNGQTDYYEMDDFTDPWKSATTDIVVFQPGILRHTEFVYHLVPLMSKEVRFVRRDLRGHGRSSGGCNDYTLDTLVDEMADFVDKIAGRPVHWIGESTAGMISIAFATKYPEKLKSLILMSSPLVLNETFLRMVSEPYMSQGEAMRKMGIVEWQKSRPVSRLGTEQPAETNEMGRFAGAEYLKWYNKMLCKHDLGGVARYCDFVATIDVSSHLDRISVPTLIIAPAKSMASPVSVNQEMNQRISNSRLVIIESVGHMVYIDEPEKVCEEVLAWVEDVHNGQIK
ncbi:hypothetical protein LTR10_017567 [Elasticomyces elasticus]|uniref:AB hydrolase-1 domain-containing protein n=1 Tax=Exophiala sideris TaxID=1016849 RepID=A0ABR0J1H0_9EURO|nr:hypothetical protein LTR10_017567 [Elasticomyces elasticus]KAK5023426.1 hypothetical protein LTS07_009301 [Exophiala sideris]KAK5028199.1 hypothetical protein LTR13_009187 [Exophiala sideris]KAK5052857.1 hypothetical protein LTR69_009683 [Exophiala sideris]KAK5178468.1 hypothetical protein LTR44_009093 [Eurotiomycetes sp. CCFEE 6388]